MLLSLPGLFLLIHTVEMADKEKKRIRKKTDYSLPSWKGPGAIVPRV